MYDQADISCLVDNEEGENMASTNLDVNYAPTILLHPRYRVPPTFWIAGLSTSNLLVGCLNPLCNQQPTGSGSAKSINLESKFFGTPCRLSSRSQIAKRKDNVTFHCVAEGNPGPQYLWTRGRQDSLVQVAITILIAILIRVGRAVADYAVSFRYAHMRLRFSAYAHIFLVYADMQIMLAHRYATFLCSLDVEI